MRKTADWANALPLPAALAGIYLLALALCLTAGFAEFFRSGVNTLDPDEHEYWLLSSDILNGHYSDTGRRTLGFPVVLALIRAVAGSFTAVQLVMTAFAATAPALLTWATWRVSARRDAALLAGLTLAVWPPQIFLSASLYSETIALPCFLLVLAAMPRPGIEVTFLRWLVVGLLVGLLTHVRTMYQLFVPLLALAIVLDIRRPWPAAKAILAMLGGFALVVLPWSVHISQRVGVPILLTANGGETLAGGLNSKLLTPLDSVDLERRSSWTGPGKWIDPGENGYLSPAELKLHYVERDALLKRRALAWIAAHPGDTLYLTARKLLYMWGIYPVFDNGLMMALFGNLPIVALMLLFFGGLAATPAIRRTGSRFYLVPLLVSGIAVISWGSWRFRQPADAAMIAVVAWWIASLIAPRTDRID
jgi:hypothetical protein